MAKGKAVKYEWRCKCCNTPTGAGQAQKEKVKELKKNKYCPKTRQMQAHEAKLIKKGN
ncbi:hypothetical protein KKC94_00250 [Patescibacteria group bacterium]|nr:hypothetical protein [Patescibacteria group bacterium]